MFLGALIGAACIVHAHVVYPLVITLIVAAGVVTTRVLGAGNPEWVLVEH